MPGLTLLVDGPSLIYRSHFAMRDSVRAPDGTPVAAAYGFLNMLARLIGDLHPAQLVCCLDADWRPQWRVDLVDSYKTHRVAADEETDDTIDSQTQIIVRILGLARISVAQSEECEAEDVIATIAEGIRGRVAVVSGDRDLFQMVRDPDRWVLYPKRGVSDLVHVDEKYIKEKYGIDGRHYGDFAILRGDPSDGLPGVPGIGEKSASLLVAKYGSLDEVVRASAGATSGPLAKVAANTDYIERADKVVRLKRDCSVGKVDLALGGQPGRTLAKISKEYALDGPVKRLLQAISSR
jgi:5'-3' exonuclease